MAKNSKNKRVSPALSLDELRSLMKLRRAADAAYSGFWAALSIYKPPPRPPGFKRVVESLIRSLGAYKKSVKTSKSK